MARAPAPESDTRKDSIVAAAAGVFLRFGFKKTSMDDLARAAGLSRQGLYLHFETKEALFREVVGHVIDTTRQGYQRALAKADLDPVERLVGAFEAFHGHALGGPGEAQMNELLEAAAQFVGDVALKLEAEFTADVARVLEKTGVAKAWKPSRITASELAAHLYATSLGLKHRVAHAAEFRERMGLAVRITVAGAAPRRA